MLKPAGTSIDWAVQWSLNEGLYKVFLYGTEVENKSYCRPIDHWGICFLAVHFMLLPNAMHIASGLPFENGPIWEELLFERCLTMSRSPSTSYCMAVSSSSRSVAVSISP
jgi:hypothetical protein